MVSKFLPHLTISQFLIFCVCFFAVLQQISGNLKLLVSHPVRASTASSDFSSHSTHSSSLFRQPNPLIPAAGRGRGTSNGARTPIYAEIMTSTGFRVGEQKCIVLRKVCVCACACNCAQKGLYVCVCACLS